MIVGKKKKLDSKITSTTADYSPRNKPKDENKYPYEIVGEEFVYHRFYVGKKCIVYTMLNAANLYVGYLVIWCSGSKEIYGKPSKVMFDNMIDLTVELDNNVFLKDMSIWK